MCGFFKYKKRYNSYNIKINSKQKKKYGFFQKIRGTSFTSEHE